MSCHTVEGAELEEGVGEGNLDVRLGGKIIGVRTYGELVTMVINPSHHLTESYRKEAGAEGGESPMPDYNSSMTVQELIDLVAFLQATYTIPVGHRGSSSSIGLSTESSARLHSSASRC